MGQEGVMAFAMEEGLIEMKKMPEENLAHLELAAGGKKKRGPRRASKQGLINTATTLAVLFSGLTRSPLKPCWPRRCLRTCLS
ncbi:MAG: hypothetical protein JXL84_03825 [Deltaproteobacteria bacterium]|nr:hypothetical protein [Deltaproteobacteria bacterium]